MKKYLILLPLIFALSSLKGQIVNIDTVKPTFVYKPAKKQLAQSEYAYSIGLKLLSIQQLPKLLKQVYSTNFYNSALTGGLLKFNDNQISYRVYGDFLNHHLSFKNECQDCEITTGNITDYIIKIGFEKNITYSRLQPYYGADIGFRRNVFKGESHNAGAINFTSPYDVVTEKNGGVFTPFVGLKFNLIQHFTMSAESGFTCMYSYERQEKMYKDAARTRTFQKYNKVEFLLNPMNILSLQYNLGSVN